MAKKSTPSFEEALEELEQIVEDMESGDLTLEESLKAFEKGVALTRSAQEALTAAEQRVKVLLEKNGEDTLVPLEPVDDE